jgi:hypothetical protein
VVNGDGVAARVLLQSALRFPALILFRVALSFFHASCGSEYRWPVSIGRGTAGSFSASHDPPVLYNDHTVASVFRQKKKLMMIFNNVISNHPVFAHHGLSILLTLSMCTKSLNIQRVCGELR